MNHSHPSADSPSGCLSLLAETNARVACDVAAQAREGPMRAFEEG